MHFMGSGRMDRWARRPFHLSLRQSASGEESGEFTIQVDKRDAIDVYGTIQSAFAHP